MTFLFELPLKRRGFFIIANKSLDDIKHGFIKDGFYYPSVQMEFERVLDNFKVSVKRIDEYYSIIK